MILFPIFIVVGLAVADFIHLEHVVIDTTRQPPFDADPAPTYANATYIVQLASASGLETARLAGQHGVVLARYLPHNAYLAYATRNAIGRLAADRNVIWIGTLRPEHKLSLTLSRYAPSPFDAPRFFNVGALGLPLSQLIVSLTVPAPDAVARLRHLHGVLGLRRIRDDRVIIDVDDMNAAAEAVAEDPAVHWVERRLRHQFLNRWARGLVQSARNTTADYVTRSGLLSWDYDLDGSGQILGLGDSGVDKHSCFFASRSTCAKSPPNTSKNLFPIGADFDTSDKIAAYIAYADDKDASGHGTHVAGTMVGDPRLPEPARGTLPTFAGMAPGARLAVVDIGDDDGSVQLPEDLHDAYLDPVYEAGARIMTNAWGASAPLYTHEAAEFDDYMVAHPDFLVVNAAGNGGACNEEMTVVTPATGKNGVASGASLSLSIGYRKTELIPPGFESASDPQLNDHGLAAFSSKGPTLDGRIKPDLVAPGYFVYSAATGQGPNGCDGELGSVVTPNAGTSMAAGVVAGTLGQIRQYLVDGFYPGGRRNPRHGFSPSGSLLKAIIIHGAQILNGTRLVSDIGIAEPERCPKIKFASLLNDMDAPSIDQGWGRPQLDQVLSFSDGDDDTLHLLGRNNKSRSTFGDPEIGHGQEHRYRFCVLDAHTALRATLVWTDPAATLGAGLQLVNDLDLSVESDGRLRYGNGAESGDRHNPVERLIWKNPRPLADIIVTVSARRIAVGLTQPYSLVLTGKAIRAGPCRPHHEMMRMVFQVAEDRPEALSEAVRLLNTARGLRAKVDNVGSASRNTIAIVVVVILIFDLII